MLTATEVEQYFKDCGVVVVATRGAWRDARCIFHEDRMRSFTFNVESGGWKCQAECGSGGLKEMAEKTGVPFREERPQQSQKSEVVCTYDYTDADGKLLYQAVRKKSARGKTFLQRRPDGSGGWIWNMKDQLPIPYRMPDVFNAREDDQVVFIVEGEKDADNLAALDLVATTNHGGAGKWKDTLSDALAGLRVVIIPDHDKAGQEHAQKVARSLHGKAREIRVLDLPGLKNKQDVSDWLDTGGDIEKLLQLVSEVKLWELPAETPPSEKASISTEKKKGSKKGKPPFISLGYGEGLYYYLPNGTNQVTALTSNNHARLGLLNLAPLTYWSEAYSNDQGHISWLWAASDCMSRCVKNGVFNPLRIRGRGAWHDQGRPVVHLGDKVVFAGELKDVGQPEEGGFIYPAAVPMQLDYSNPLGSTQASGLSTLCDLLSWEKPVNGRLLAGWMAISPICGALAWRPHIWMTGAAGTGKSWVMDNIMRPLLGQVGLFVQSDTTEAGIRQALGYDARPVLFDEAEGESERAQARMQNVLGLMRQSSSENGSAIIKGSSTGQVKIYSIRSCFAFSSIGVGLKQHSDTTRVTVLGLCKRRGTVEQGREAFKVLRDMTGQLLTKTWISGLHARMISLIPTVRDNAETFAGAAAKIIGSQRMGDQLGALLAGAYALHKDDRISNAAAEAWISKQDWTEQTTIQESPDEYLCLQRILQHVVTIRKKSGIEEMSVAEMVELSEMEMDPNSSEYHTILLRLGMRVEPENVTIANQHSGIQNILKGTPWVDWGRLLRRLPDAKLTSHPVRFAGIRARGTVIPRSVFSK